MPIPGDAILVSITRDTEFILPHGSTVLLPWDRILCLTRDDTLHMLTEGLGPGGQMTTSSCCAALVIPAGVPWSVCGVLCPAQPPPLRLLPQRCGRVCFSLAWGCWSAGLAAMPEFCRCPDPAGLTVYSGVFWPVRRTIRRQAVTSVVCLSTRWPAGPGCGLSRCAAPACGCSCLRWRQMPPRPDPGIAGAAMRRLHPAAAVLFSGGGSFYVWPRCCRCCSSGTGPPGAGAAAGCRLLLALGLAAWLLRRPLVAGRTQTLYLRWGFGPHAVRCIPCGPLRWSRWSGGRFCS